MTRNYFLQYTQLDIPEFRETLVQFMEYVKKSIDKRALHKREHDSRVNERQMQTTMEKVDTSKALDASSVIIKSNGTESQEQDTSSRSGNDAHVDDADIRPIYDEEPKAENAEQCHDTCPLPAKLTDDKTNELSNQLLESENVCLKKTVAQCQKDFAKLEAHCINLELQMENNVLKSGQQSQFLKEKGNEAKVNNDIDEIETIKIELEHSVAKLLAENELLHKEKEHLKQTYKYLFDSIKTTRVQTKNQNDSLMAQLNKKSNENADVLAQIQKKGFAIAALKNELRKLTGIVQPTVRIHKTVVLMVPPERYHPQAPQSYSDPPNGLKEDITNQCESKQALDAPFLNVQMMSDHNSSDLAPQRQEMSVENVSLGSPEKTDSSHQGLEFLFSHLIEEYYTPTHGHAEENNNDQASNASLKVWELVDKPFGKMIIKLKWLWKNKKDEDQTVIRNKARLVAKGYAQEEGIDFEESLHQSELCLKQLDSEPTQHTNHPEKVYLLRKALYGLKQAPRAWYDELSNFLMSKGFTKGTIHMGLWYPKGSGFELTAFSDADHAGCVDTRKSTSGGIQFLGDKLVSWMSKKQDCTAMSSAEAEYMALFACYAQVENGIIELYFVRTEYQLADMFTKALPEDRFKYLVRRIGMRCLTPAELEVLANETA
ncbi:retrovirus-related pol polyprotein from transposon TNT 1-94 [Tanacetum coccineum]